MRINIARFLLKTSALIFLFFISSTSHALTAIAGKVTVVEGTYMPGMVTFVMDTGNTTCPIGTWMIWKKADPENNKSVYSLLMAALTSGKRIDFVMNDGDATCKGQFIHLLAN